MKLICINCVFFVILAVKLATTAELYTNPDDNFFATGSKGNIRKDHDENQIKNGISKGDLANFWPKPKRPLTVEDSPITNYYISKNPKLSYEYVRSDIENTAINNLKLRNHFLNNNAKFNKLFDALKKIEEEIVSTNKLIDTFKEDLNTRIGRVNETIEDAFKSIRLDINLLNTSVEILDQKAEQNQKQNGLSLTSLGDKANELGISSKAAFGKFEGLLGSISKLKPPKCKYPGMLVANEEKENSEEKEENAKETDE